MCPTLDCKKGGLTTARHKNLRDEVVDLASKAFTPTHVCEDPNIHIGCTMCGGNEDLKGSPLKYKGEMKGDILITDIWMQGTETIHGMRVVNTDATS